MRTWEWGYYHNKNNKQTNKQTANFVQLFSFRLHRQECLEEPPKLLSQGHQGSRHIRPPPLPSPSPPAATASDDVPSRLGKESSLEVVQQPWWDCWAWAHVHCVQFNETLCLLKRTHEQWENINMIHVPISVGWAIPNLKTAHARQTVIIMFFIRVLLSSFVHCLLTGMKMNQ